MPESRRLDTVSAACAIACSESFNQPAIRGEVEWVLGVSSPNRYRVMELTNPARL